MLLDSIPALSRLIVTVQAQKPLRGSMQRCIRCRARQGTYIVSVLHFSHYLALVTVLAPKIRLFIIQQLAYKQNEDELGPGSPQHLRLAAKPACATSGLALSAETHLW